MEVVAGIDDDLLKQWKAWHMLGTLSVLGIVLSLFTILQLLISIDLSLARV